MYFWAEKQYLLKHFQHHVCLGVNELSIFQLKDLTRNMSLMIVRQLKKGKKESKMLSITNDDYRVLLLEQFKKLVQNKLIS